jgi:hypothetical protein
MEIEGLDELKRTLAKTAADAKKAEVAINAVGKSHQGRPVAEVERELRRRVPSGMLSAREIKDIAKKIAGH